MQKSHLSQHCAKPVASEETQKGTTFTPDALPPSPATTGISDIPKEGERCKDTTSDESTAPKSLWREAGGCLTSLLILLLLVANNHTFIRNLFKESYLRRAVEMNSSPNLARFFIAMGADVEDTKNGYSLLDVAVKKKNAEMCNALLENGADAGSSLHLAAAISTPEICRLLIAHGADCNIKDSMGSTPLHEAVKHNNIDTCRELLQQGADINSRDRLGRSPLYYAAGGRNAKLYGFLLKNGAEN